MDNIAGTKSTLTWVVHISVAVIVALWVFPTLGLFVSILAAGVSVQLQQGILVAHRKPGSQVVGWPAAPRFRVRQR